MEANFSLFLEQYANNIDYMSGALDIQYRWIFVNETFQRAHRFQHNSNIEIGATFQQTYKNIMKENEYKMALDRWKRALRGDEFTVRDPYELNNTINIYEISYKCVRRRDGTIIGAMCLSKDVTREEAYKRIAGDFITKMSHELRTPLNSIIGFSQLIERANDTNLIQEYNKYIYNSGKILLNLVNDIIYKFINKNE